MLSFLLSPALRDISYSCGMI